VPCGGGRAAPIVVRSPANRRRPVMDESPVGNAGRSRRRWSTQRRYYVSSVRRLVAMELELEALENFQEEQKLTGCGSETCAKALTGFTIITP
jgi:hypothetical protein